MQVYSYTKTRQIMMEEFDKDGSGTIDCGELLMLVDKVMAEM